MSYTVTVKSVFQQLANAAYFVREKYNLNGTYILADEFELELGIKVHCPGDILSYDDMVEFRSEQDYVCFLLRWS